MMLDPIEVAARPNHTSICTLISAESQSELAASIFKQAARDLRRFYGATTTIEQELYFDAYSWLMSDDWGWPFSFMNVCQLLNLSPEDVRQELVGDIALGKLSQWTRRSARAVRRIGNLFLNVSQVRADMNASKPVVSIQSLSLESPTLR